MIEGSAKGARLRPPGGFARGVTRATRACVFEALGDMRCHEVLDLYAGAGALGIEALSRGAAAATFVESSQQAIGRLEANLQATGVQERAEVLWTKLEAVLARPAPTRYDTIFVDPPPNATVRTVVRDLEALVIGGFLADRGSIVVCRSIRESQLKPLGLTKLWERNCNERYVTAFTHQDEE